MKLRTNKPLRNYGIYTLLNRTFVLFKRSDDLSFLFTFEGWSLHGPVDYRVSHGHVYRHGELTSWTDEDLVDTGQTASPPRLTSLLDIGNL
ncbi:MAG TPA: hypothetical protein VJM12_04360 [Pyrinomonadaceae bacterium]|nr:hypothetical protein [Pyrinomonadaceae bacterium]